MAQGQTSAPAAATPAQGEGGKRERALEQQVSQLEGKVAELTTTQQKIQQQYFDSFTLEKATRFANEKHQATIKDLEARLWSMASTFVTPEKSPPVPSGGFSLPVWPMQMPVEVQFSAGVGGDPVNRDKTVRKSRVRVWRPEGGEKEKLPLPMGPFPFELKFDPVVPVYGKGSPGELGNAAGGQAAGEEKAKGPEARKEEARGQSAAAEAPTAVAPVDSESEDDS